MNPTIPPPASSIPAARLRRWTLLPLRLLARLVLACLTFLGEIVLLLLFGLQDTRRKPKFRKYNPKTKELILRY